MVMAKAMDRRRDGLGTDDTLEARGWWMMGMMGAKLVCNTQGQYVRSPEYEAASYLRMRNELV